MQCWFYVRTGDLTSTLVDGKKNTRYLLASVMTPMSPSMQVTPSSEVDAAHEACDNAFALVC